MITYEKYGEALDLTQEEFDKLVSWAEKQLVEGSMFNAKGYNEEVVKDNIDSIRGWFGEEHDEMLADPQYFSNRIGTDKNPNNFDDNETGVTGYTLRQQNVVQHAVLLDKGEVFLAWAQGNDEGYNRCREKMLALENAQEEVLKMKREIRDEAEKVAEEVFCILFGEEDSAITSDKLSEIADNMLLAELIGTRNRAVTALERAKDGKDMMECFDV